MLLRSGRAAGSTMIAMEGSQPAGSRADADWSGRVAKIVAVAEQAAERARAEAERRAEERIAEADRAARYRVDAAEAEADELLESARTEARELLDSARAEAERLTAQAREERERAALEGAARVADLEDAARKEAARIQSEADDYAKLVRGGAEEEARSLTREARFVAQAVLEEGTGLHSDLQAMSQSLRRNAELLLRDVRDAHARMAGEIDRTVGTDPAPARRTASRDLDDDVPEFIPPR